MDQDAYVLDQNFYIYSMIYELLYIILYFSGWAVWVFTKGKTITPEQFVHIHNDLLKNGISVPWRLARCGYVYEK